MLTVSNYHYIRTEFNTKFPSIFGVTPDVFKKQLLLLKDKGDFIRSRDLVVNVDEILNSNSNYFLITFDDGLKEQYQLALPILDELEVPVILFANSKNSEEKKVSTVHKIHLLRSIIAPSDFLQLISIDLNSAVSNEDTIKSKQTYPFDDTATALLKYLLNFKMDFNLQEQLITSIFKNYFEEEHVFEQLYMSDAELMEVGRKGFLGSHTHTHYPIGLLNENQMRFELEHSKKYLEQLTGSAIETVAYPYGTPEACTLEVAKMAESVGYKIGFTTTSGTNSIHQNRLLLNRFDCNDRPGGKNYNEL